jgi:hypothetical protein
MPKDRSLPDIAKAYGRSRWLRGYVRGKLAWDPVFPVARREIVSRQQPVVDIGCGIGLLGISMRAAGIPLRFRGTDIVPWKVNKAKDVVRYYGFEDIGFDVVDALSTQIPPGATVCMVDVLHYLEPASQLAMLGRLADAVDSGSLVLLRTGLRGTGWRYLATMLEELWTRASGWIRGGAINFPSREDIEQFFAERRLKTTITPLWGRTPFASYLIRIDPISRGRFRQAE